MSQVLITIESTEVVIFKEMYIELEITVACSIGISFIVSQKELLACTLHSVTSLSVGH
jgi:hypothetical protein